MGEQATEHAAVIRPAGGRAGDPRMGHQVVDLPEIPSSPAEGCPDQLGRQPRRGTGPLRDAPGFPGRNPAAGEDPLHPRERRGGHHQPAAVKQRKEQAAPAGRVSGQAARPLPAEVPVPAVNLIQDVRHARRDSRQVLAA